MIKTKVSDVAKDFEISSKELIELLEQSVKVTKKASSTLTETEMDVVFDLLTKSKEVKNFKEYFNSGAEQREAAAAERQAKKDKKLAEQMAILEQLKNAQKPKEEPKVEAPKAEQKPEPKVEKKAETKVEAKPQKAAEKPKKEAPAQPVNPIVIKSKQAPSKENKTPGEAPNRGPAQIRRVDTRSSDFDVEKYNERYEQIAPANSMRDNTQRKQKIKQKSQDYKRPQNARRETEADKMRRLQLERIKKTPITVTVGDEITVGELAAALKKTAAEVIKELMKLGVMATITQTIDYDTAELIVTEMGAKIKRAVVVTIEEQIMDETEDKAEDLKPRSPVVVVMGHVDHGKTSLLDAIRNSAVTDTEAGGITQHIGAYRVNCNDQEITFLDTPGHAAFTSMRQRGAQSTDIVVLVVAADDGIMPQTIEAINHARAAEVEIIVAINKMDKPEANPDRILQQLTEHMLVPEEWGGDTICVPVSAKTHKGIDNLLESILLVAEVMDLKANPDRRARGVVIEARLDKGRGPVATLLVQNGTLNEGDIIVAGTSVGRVRLMTNERGEVLKTAGPSVPVEITGLTETPAAGDRFDAVSNERLARQLVEDRKQAEKDRINNARQKVTLDNLFDHMSDGELKNLNIVLKADVQGSVEAVRENLIKLSNEEVRVNVIHEGVGAVNDSDVMLAAASGAIIVGFNVRPDVSAKVSAERDGIDIRLYRVIYDCLEEITAAMKGMLAPKYREVQLGSIEVRTVYHISSVGTVAGAYVTDGKVNRNCSIRVVRDGIVLAEDKIDSLRRFKDDVKEVSQGYECGIGLEKFADIKEGDVFEAFIMEEYTE